MDWSDRIGRRIKLRDLHILMAIADTGSMAKAAAKLRISTPVVSKTMLGLEHTLAVKLLDRGSRGVELTPYGRALLQCGINVFDDMRQAVRAIANLADPSSGEVRIGCTEIVMSNLVPVIAGKFLRQHPQVRLDVSLTNPGEQQIQELQDRKIDLLITRGLGEFAESDFNTEILFDEPFVVVAGDRSPWAKKRSFGLAHLIKEPWVLPPYHTAPGALIAEMFRDAGLQPPQPSLSTISSQCTIALISTGQFVGFLPASIASLNARRGALKILPLRLASPRVPLAIVWVKNRTMSPAVDLFISCTRDVVTSLARPQKAAS
jgi:DNA-binding transcriptional LysR family regulator